MRASMAMTVFFVLAGSCAGEDASATKTVGFDSEKAGAVASGFTVHAGEWKVIADESAPSKPNALAQTAKNDTSVFNMVLASGSAHKDVDVSVKLKSISGEIDQGGGVVWRAKDAKNYYVARYNPLETNFRVYHVINGKRTQLGTAKIPGEGAGWHTVRITMTGDRIECYLDGVRHLDVKDTSLSEAGAAGLWTKADAETLFDDFTVSGK